MGCSACSAACTLPCKAAGKVHAVDGNLGQEPSHTLGLPTDAVLKQRNEGAVQAVIGNVKQQAVGKMCCCRAAISASVRQFKAAYRQQRSHVGSWPKEWVF